MLNNLRENPIFLTDCYNLSHQQLKCNTDWEVSHMYNRAKPMIMYGLQEIVTELLKNQITIEMVDEADAQAKRMGLNFPREIWERVVNECNGYIPISVEIVPEGTYVPTGTPFAQVANMVEGFGEMVTWFEAIFMMAYFPSACATRAFEMRQYLEEIRRKYGYDEGFLWRFHSFGFRGHKSLEDAYWAGTAWNLFLQGTDDFHISHHMPVGVMGSISALAHKVTQQYDNEYECFTHTIDTTAEVGEKIVAMVIDTYDAWNVINNWVVPLTNYAKEKGVHVVWRPDSGDIFEQVVAIHKIAIENGLTNCNVIIGEGMSFEEVKKFDAKLLEAGVPLNFVNYGIGAGFYKDIERDTLGWAMKTAYSNGEPRMKIVKSNPFKQSIPNIVHLMYNENDELVVHDGVDNGENVFEVIYVHLDDKDRFLMGIDDYYYMNEVTPDHFEKVRRRALVQKTTQERIILSPETQKLIAEFHKRYDK